MNVIFITISYPISSDDSNLYTDLMDQFTEHGHKVYVVCSVEKRYNTETFLSESNGIKALRVKTGTIKSNNNYFTKGLSVFRLQSNYKSAIKKYFPGISFDLILYSTPPIFYCNLIRYLKSIHQEASTYLMLKDIFPQDAIDLNLLSKRNPIYWYFKKKEKQLYHLSDNIGCMSPANVNYLYKNNPYLPVHKIDICTNSLKNRGQIDLDERTTIRKKIRDIYSIGDKELFIVYGGNLGISQGLSFMTEIFSAYENKKNIKFLVAGNGTSFSLVDNYIKRANNKNVTLIKRVSTKIYRELLIAADIGLIFISPKSSIPNFPSRLTQYLEIGLPVIACTDKVTDVGDIIENAGCGFKVLSGDIDQFKSLLEGLMKSPENLKLMSLKARNLFEESYTTENSYQQIISRMTKIKVVNINSH